jgi:Zn-dependent M28 family amino/carboxypeptidase
MLRFQTVVLLLTFNFAPLAAQPLLSADSLLAHLKELSSDRYEGRRTQEAGNLLAGEYIRQRFEGIGLLPFTDYFQSFKFYNRWAKTAISGRNVVGYVKGTAHPDLYIVLSAHYDHVGVQKGEIYNGADDNASGTSALIELARYFHHHPPRHSIIFAAFDAEELGLQGAAAFVDEPPVPLDSIRFNLNMDMIGRNAKDELYVCGTSHYPFFRAPLEELARQSRLSISFGHDGPPDDWTNSSDHARFHRQGIPFLYFGVEDHEDYHRPSDVFEKIKPGFYADVADYILQSLRWLDEHWVELEAASNGRK